MYAWMLRDNKTAPILATPGSRPGIPSGCMLLLSSRGRIGFEVNI